MPTLIGHTAPALCLGLGLGPRVIPIRLLAAAVLCSWLPDADVLGFKFGVAYSDILGHRGLTHSLIFALFVGTAAACCAPLLHARRITAFFSCGLAVAGHIALDALTDGGLGVAFLWPFSDKRFFFSFQPIVVSPFSPRALISERGLRIMLSEWMWVWMPSIAAMIILLLLRGKRLFRK